MEQGTLLLRQAATTDKDISDDFLLGKCPDLRAALRLCIESSGMCVKEVAFHLKLQKEHLSRMVSVSDDPRHFPPEMIESLMDICGNLIPLRWLALSKGYGIYKLKSRLEEENDQLREKLRRQEEQMAAITSFLKEVKL